VVDAFVEKPDAATAAGYVSSGFLWNSGNFLFRADTLLGELARYEPEMAQAVEAAVENAKIDLGFVRLDSQAFAASPQRSIDYAVMEKTQRAAVVEGRFRWSDIGSWDAVFDVGGRDGAGNFSDFLVKMFRGGDAKAGAASQSAGFDGLGASLFGSKGKGRAGR